MNGFCSAGELIKLENEDSSVIAVIGCGGKTSLIASLANEFRHRKVLVTPTTKIFPMNDEGIILRTTQGECLSHKPVTGIQCFGELNQKTGKLEALSIHLLEEIIPKYDLVLLEADGSAGMPCKGWLPDEPVIPPFCTHTIGVVTMNALGHPADNNFVLRLPEFLKLTGLQQGEIITLKALTDMVCADNGMFRTSLGRQSIFVNLSLVAPAVEDHATLLAVEEWLEIIQEENRGRFACLAYGSVMSNFWKEVLP